MSIVETEETNAHRRRVVRWLSIPGGLVIVGAGWTLRATGEIGIGDTIATGLSVVLCLVAVNQYAFQGKFGASFGEKGAVRRHWKLLVAFFVFMVAVPWLSSVGGTKHEYLRSIAVINGVLIGASFLLWAIDRQPEVCANCGSLLVEIHIDEDQAGDVPEKNTGTHEDVPTLIADEKKTDTNEDLCEY